MSRPARNCPRCGEWIIRPRPEGVSFHALATILTDAGNLEVVCANRQCRTRLQLAVDGPRRYRLVVVEGAPTRAAS